MRGKTIKIYLLDGMPTALVVLLVAPSSSTT